MATEQPLQVRLYGEGLGDYQTVNSWWKERHGEDLPETILPPLGIIVERDGEPIGALWCYECFGIGVCFLEFAVTRPGLSLADVRQAVQVAVDGCVSVAKSHGDFSYFRFFTTPSMARMLRGMGMAEADGEYSQLAFRRG